MRWLYFIFSHSFFTALGAVALCLQTAMLLHINLSAYLYYFIFFSTVCSYNFYWIVCGYTNSNLQPMPFIKTYFYNILFFLLSGFAMVYCLWQLPNLFPVIGAGLLLTILYTIPITPIKLFPRIRSTGLIKTFLLAFTWAFVTVYLPYQASPIVAPKAIFIFFNNRFLFLLMLCIIFDARDTSVDQIRGLHTLTTVMKPHAIHYLMFIIFLAYVFNGIFFRIYFHETNQIFSLVITGIATLLLYWFSLKKQGHFFYYFLVDGAMIFTALVTYLANGSLKI